MKKIKYAVDGLEKINILVYPVRFNCESNDLSSFFHNTVKKEVKEKFDSAFRNFEDRTASLADILSDRALWFYHENLVNSLEFNIHQNHQKIDFEFACKNHEITCKLVVQLEDNEFHAFQNIVARGFKSMELGAAQECKRLDMVTTKFLFLQCKTPENKKIIQNALLQKISAMQGKNKGAGEDRRINLLSWDEESVFPEVFFADTFMPTSPFWLDSIVKYNLENMEAQGKIEEDGDYYRLVNPEKNPEFYSLSRPARDGNYVSEKDIAEKNYYMIHKIKEQYGKTIFIWRVDKRNELSQKAMQSFLNRQKTLLRKMREDLIKTGIVSDEYQTLLLKRLSKYMEK